MTVGRWHVAAAAVLIAVASSASSLGNGFTYDDRPLVADNARVHALANVPSLFGQTYWPESNGAALYRPLTLTLFAVEWAAGGGGPFVFHLVNVLLYAAVCVTVALLLAQLLGKAEDGNLLALGAAALFAAHPVHVEAVGNVVGQSELVVALALTIAMTMYLRARAHGPMSKGVVSGMCVLYAVACMAKEHGVMFPLLLIAAEATILRDPVPDHGVSNRLRPIGILAVVGGAFLVLRAGVVGGVTGEFAHLAWGDATAGDRVLTMLRVAPEWARLLFWPSRLSADYSPREIEVVRELTSGAFTGIVLLGLVVTLIIYAWRRWPLIAFGLLWIAIALVPVSNIFVLSGVLLAERTLFFASIGAAIVVAGALAALPRHAGSMQSTFAARAVALAVGALVVAGTVKSAARQRVWRDNPTFFAQLLKDAPLSYRAHWARGAQLFDAGNKPEGEKALRHAAELFPRDPDLIEDLATRYLRGGHCAPAIPRYRQVLEMVPDRATARVGLVACLMRNREFAQAAAEAREGLRFGTDSAQLIRLARTADSLGGR